MDFLATEKSYGSSTEAPFFAQWNGLPTLEDSPFKNPDPWRHNRLPPFATLNPQAVHPEQLHITTQWSPSLSSSLSTTPSSTSASTSSSTSPNNTAKETNTNTYRPRAPTAKRNGINRSIKPRSKKHAHELSRNRTAATKYRNRRKSFVDDLQVRCADAEKTRERTMELVKALREEVLVLRREVLRHAGCGGGSGSFACGNRWDGRRVGIL
jgi:hypothetical protein